jgi:hypothetical protein
MSSGMAHFALKCNRTNYACLCAWDRGLLQTMLWAETNIIMLGVGWLTLGKEGSHIAKLKAAQ